MTATWRAERVDGSPRCELGESPTWWDEGKALAWLDLGQPWIYLLQDNEIRRIATPDGVSLTSIDRSLHGWACLTRTGWCRLDDDFRITARGDILGAASARMNDGCVDRSGRQFGGSISLDAERPGGCLYVIAPDGGVAQIGPAGFSNGMTFCERTRSLWHVDSADRQVRRWTKGPHGWHADPFWRVESTGIPDGLALDDQGGIWVAIWGEGRAVRVDPRGHLTDEVLIDTPHATSVAIARGAAYLTSAADEETDGGRLYAAPVPYSGVRAQPGSGR